MSTSVLKALPGKLDIKRHSPSILYISRPALQYQQAFSKPCLVNLRSEDTHLVFSMLLSWYFSGPTILSITDADKSIATASGEIKVGRYQFQLTVKDVEELKSTSTLVIDVRKGTKFISQLIHVYCIFSDILSCLHSQGK